MSEVRVLRKKSYLAMIRNAAAGENRMFRNFFVSVNGVEQDAFKDGRLSCAAFVSGVLVLNGLMARPHATVGSTEKALAAEGWTEISEPREGAVVVWDAVTYEDGQTHAHIGFAVGEGRAVSNASNAAAGVPREHDLTYDGTRNLVRIWWHPSLDE